MNSIQDISDLLQAELPGAPAPLLLRTARFVFDDFCRETGALRETLTLDVVADQEDYAIVPTVGDVWPFLMVKVESGDANGYAELDQGYWEFDGTGTLTLLYPGSEDTTDGLRVTVACRPRLSSKTIPVDESFLDKHQEAIADGVKARLYATPHLGVFNADMAAYFEGRYRSGKAQAKLTVAYDGRLNNKAQLVTMRRDF
jgi:hypothetical protein